MAKLPEPIHENNTAAAIVKWYEKDSQFRRPHLGCSEIGKECDRALWYSFRWASSKQFDGRMLRLFQRGHREESLIFQELRNIGAVVHESDPDTKKQIRFVGYKGHFSGSADAIARNLPEAPKTWALVECKTHSEKSFNALLKDRVQKAKPEHFVQMQMYMGFAELERALYFAVNKNTDELYTEWVHFDKAMFDKYKARAQKIIDAVEPPPGISNDPAWFGCKFCDHKAICHAEKVADKNCRTCIHSTPIERGAWNCEVENCEIPEDVQRTGCDYHLFIPPLIPYADYTDAGDNWVSYVDKHNQIEFANVIETGSDCELPIKLTSDDLTKISVDHIGEQIIQTMKEVFPGSTVIGSAEEAPF